ncbi:amylosucrase [Robiginitalea sp. M366]|uniref:amylosucrase n=1 Tax=Robiginitalea aestuariiviva TaxID=3036903 RepID=UPI00240E67D1|nr:amylosucrase [Robiginitalea aestuariiviva]MDG1571631.1 amylosucrase [Robiginitalea aestuariiviva]
MNQNAIHRLLAGEKLQAPGRKIPRELFEKRLAANFTLVQDLFFGLYPDQEDAFSRLHGLLAQWFEQRPAALKAQDLQRQQEGNWYQSHRWVGMQLYVDRFSTDLKGLEAKLPYFQKLGINFLHLMPLTKRPKGPSDGGYAVNSYTDIDPRYGTDADFKQLSKTFREHGICLMLDFVVNHTSDEFPWAVKAKAGDPKYQQYYYTYPDRSVPDAFEASLPEIFPESAPGNFTYIPEMDRWVMTVFNTYQWDLNYTNPEVFLEMLGNLVHLANLGIDVVRFDALAFLWKKIGTVSQNLPEAHRLISLFRLCLQTVAPGVVLLAEAIVAPHEIVKYFGEGRLEGNACELAYHATLMACLWDAVATKKTLLLYKSLHEMPAKPESCTWINYIRCHDDIGLGFDDAHIAALGWNPQMHRRFLLDYYCQRLDWSPAAGAVFMYNPLTGDGRITGSAASLLGLEKALEAGDMEATTAAMDKLVMLYGIVLAAPGVPLVYAGDELGMRNDYSYLKNPDMADDSRWVNRPIHDWDTVARLGEPDLPATRIFQSLQHLIGLRKSLPELTDANNTSWHLPGNPHLLVMERRGNTGGLLVIANFDAAPQVLNASWVERLGYLSGGQYENLVDGSKTSIHSGLLELEPYALLWLKKF